MSAETKIYAVIDTNVLVSALFSSTGASNPSRVIKSVFEGHIVPLYNAEIIEEYRDVLSRPKFRFDESLIDSIITAFTAFGINTHRTPISEESFPDADDIVFYEITMSHTGAYLVTGNIKHFPKRSFVVTPAQMVEILNNRGFLLIK